MKTAFIKTVLVASALAASMTIAGAQAVGGGNNGRGPGGPGEGSSGRLDATSAPIVCPPTHLCRGSTKPRRPRPVKVYGECRCEVTTLRSSGTISYRETCYRFDDFELRHKICKL